MQKCKNAFTKKNVLELENTSKVNKGPLLKVLYNYYIKLY